MTRDEAISIACTAAKAKPQSYYAEPFQPHEWVIDAIMAVGAERDEAQMLCRDARLQAMDRGASYQAVVAERDDARANWQGADGRADAMERERDAYRAMLCDVIARAHPNERDHPAMAKQWKRATELLEKGVPIDAPRTDIRADYLAAHLWLTQHCIPTRNLDGTQLSLSERVRFAIEDRRNAQSIAIANSKARLAVVETELEQLQPLASLVGDWEWSQLDRHDIARDDRLADQICAAFAAVEAARNKAKEADRG